MLLSLARSPSSSDHFSLFQAKFFQGNKIVYLPNPSWGNHTPIMKHAGLDVKSYRYYDPKTCGFDFNGAKEDIEKIPENSIILFHACAVRHDLWSRSRPIALVLVGSSTIQRVSILDPNSGMNYRRSLNERNCWSSWIWLIKVLLVEISMKMPMRCENSSMISTILFSLNRTQRTWVSCPPCSIEWHWSSSSGLYGERVGAFTAVCENKEEADRVMSQLKILIRPMYSNPPVHGARIAARILTQPDLRALWLKEVKLMADRIITMRQQLVDNLKKNGSKKNWQHITDQIGMFCFTGLNQQQVTSTLCPSTNSSSDVSRSLSSRNA